jgi:hypothetical protein
LDVSVCKTFVDGGRGSWELVEFVLCCRVEGYVLTYSFVSVGSGTAKGGV